MHQLNLYGPPGAGKSRALVELFLQLVDKGVPPAQIAAITFTRSAAGELRERLARSLGIRGDDREYRRQLPFVGTIHSLCMRAADIHSAQIVDSKKIAHFSASVGCLAPTLLSGVSFDTEDAGPESSLYLPADAPLLGNREIDTMLAVSASAQHRLLSVQDAMSSLSFEQLASVPPGRLLYLHKQYTEWKRDQAVYDYEDLLQEGLKQPLPVRAILCDEAQDNSPLLWKVLGAWEQAPDIQLSVCAGDPYQAIYVFAGAKPSLFSSRPGKWKTVGNSYRLGSEDSDYAKRLLLDYVDDDWAENMLKTWDGVGGSPVDGSVFILGRTRLIVTGITNKLQDRGVPYRLFRGVAPLETKAARGWAALHLSVEAGDMMPPELVAVLDALQPSALPRGVKVKALRYAKSLPKNYHLSLLEVHAQLQVDLTELLNYGFQYSGYFRDVARRFGSRGLTDPPKQTVGTIHAAKGKEADTVVLYRNWGFLPMQSLILGGTARKEEACVAYVGVTRHRHRLVLQSGDSTISKGGLLFPFPTKESSTTHPHSHPHPHRPALGEPAPI